VLDAATPGDHDWLARALSELLEGEGSLVIRHADRLGTQRLRTLWLALEQTLAAGRQKQLWVAVTISRSPLDTGMASLLQFFPGTVELPPLRQHIEDLHELVPFFLARLSHSGSLTCSPAAMQLLLRSGWPGNIEQLRQVLTTVASHRRTGTIRPDDLPPQCWTVSRRLLTPLESMERDAIVQSLLDYQGNKLQAAGSLGMSRATIYRKIHEYGILTPAPQHHITPHLEPRHAAGAAHARRRRTGDRRAVVRTGPATERLGPVGVSHEQRRGCRSPPRSVTSPPDRGRRISATVTPAYASLATLRADLCQVDPLGLAQRSGKMRILSSSGLGFPRPSRLLVVHHREPSGARTTSRSRP
jgi:hypothetical protein